MRHHTIRGLHHELYKHAFLCLQRCSSVAHSAHSVSCSSKAWSLAAEQRYVIPRSQKDGEGITGYKATRCQTEEEPMVMFSAWHSTSVLQRLQKDDQFSAAATLAHQSSTHQQRESVRECRMNSNDSSITFLSMFKAAAINLTVWIEKKIETAYGWRNEEKW